MEENMGASAEAADQQNTSSQAMQEQQEQYVPLSALQAERRERQQLQDSVRALQEHMNLMQTNFHNAQSSKQNPQMSDDDVMTFGDFKKIAGEFQKQTTMETQELKMQTAHPDYQDVVKNYLPDVIKQDPDLKDVILNSPNPYKTAYYLAKRSDSYLQARRENQRPPEAKKAEHNLQRAGNLSSVGSSSTESANYNPYKQMNDSDFRKLVSKNMGTAY